MMFYAEFTIRELFSLTNIITELSLSCLTSTFEVALSVNNYCSLSTAPNL